MLKCENYKMFYGSMRIVPKNKNIKPFTVEGTWLYRPDTDCWYCGGCSYPSDICDEFSIVEK